MPSNQNTANNTSSFFKKIERFSEWFDTTRKILFNFLIIVLTFVLLVFLLRTSAQKRLKVMPVIIPESLQKLGFTPEVFASKILDRIASIKAFGSEYYRNNDIPLSTGDQEVELVNSLMDKTPLSEFKEVIIALVNRSQKKAVGEIVESAQGYEITFRIDQTAPMSTNASGADSLIQAAAVYIMETTAPYDLGAYYFVKEQYAQCLQLMQRLINNRNGYEKYLAMHIRGNVYIMKNEMDLARSILDSSLKMNKSGTPWLTYNSMGAIYHNTHDYERAKQWYRQSIKANPNGYNAQYNYGEVLMDQYYFQQSPAVKNYADSALYYFNLAANNDPNNINPYLGMLRAYAALGNRKAGNELFYKCLEMDPNNNQAYIHMQSLAITIGDTTLENYCARMLEPKK